MPVEKTAKGTLIVLKLSNGKHPKWLRTVREVRYKPSLRNYTVASLFEKDPMGFAQAQRVVFIDHGARVFILKDRWLETESISALTKAYDKGESCPFCKALPGDPCDAALHS